MRRKVVAMIVVVLFSSVLLMTGQAAAKDPITIWAGSIHPGFEALFSNYQEKYSDFEIEYEFVPFKDYAQKVIAAARTNQLPDILVLQPKQPAAYGKLGYLRPIEGIIEHLKTSGSVFSEQDLKFNTIDDHVWGIPWHSIPHVLFYRTDWFEEAGLTPPTSWEEFTLAAEKLTTGDRQGFVGFMADPSVGHLLHEWMAARGAETFNENMEVIINSPETWETLDMLAGLYKQGYMYQGSTAYDMGQARLYFVNDGAAMLTTSTSFLGNFIDSDIDERVGVVAIPKNGGTGNYYAFQSMAITKDADDIEACIEILKRLYKPENMNKFFASKRVGYVPCDANLVQSGLFWESEHNARFKRLLEPAAEVVKNGWYPGMKYQVNQYVALFDAQNIYQDMLLKMVIDGQSAQDAAAWAQEKMESIMRGD